MKSMRPDSLYRVVVNLAPTSAAARAPTVHTSRRFQQKLGHLVSEAEGGLREASSVLLDFCRLGRAILANKEKLAKDSAS